MQINHAVDALMVILQADKVSDGAEIIAEMEVTGGLNARENTAHDVFAPWGVDAHGCRF
jgi:hypothetical protein